MVDIVPTPEEFAEWREMEVEWLAYNLGEAIANLGYAVGMGIPPKREQLERAGGLLFDRYLSMYGKVYAATSPTPEDSSHD